MKTFQDIPFVFYEMLASFSILIAESIASIHVVYRRFVTAIEMQQEEYTGDLDILIHNETLLGLVTRPLM